MGFFAGLDQDKYDRQYNDGYLFQRFGSYLKLQRHRIVVLTTMGLLVSLAMALIPIIVAATVDVLENQTGVDRLILLMAALSVTVVAQYGGNWLRRRAVNRAVGSIMAQMRTDALTAAVNRDMAFYDENKSGKILSRITNDTEEFGQVVIVTSDVISQLIEAAFLVIVLFSKDVILTLILLAFMPLVVGVALILRKFARDVTRQGSRVMAAVNDNIQESVTGISVAKNFRQESMIYDEFDRINKQSYAVNLRRGFVLALVFPVLNALAGVAIGTVVYVGAVAVVGATISISVWYLYIQSIDSFWFPFINIASYWSQFQQAMSSLERIFALIDAENTVRQIDDQPASHIRGQVTFDDVHFSYNSGPPILAAFNLDIQRGENIAFVGHTGAGKSSIAKLIMRFYEFQEGRILIDGQDIRSFDMHDYRCRLGFVPQSPFLFNGTIADNIRYGRPDATDSQIEQIAYSIGNGEWLETIPDGLQSDVGERGSHLSMGQRQLVSLLRVLAQEPAIFILDEATASVDPFTETQIQEALDLILAQSTSILIAHRLSTIRSADRIIVLREGAIIEEGSHDSLMVQGGHYAELYNTYFRHQSLSYIENSRAMLTSD
jgi:ATP-binding cassette subfamily B protein